MFNKTFLKQRKRIATCLLVVMAIELVAPTSALALTSGPSQPEFQGFSPLATTSLVDPFSGDFSYNIPLLDIDGYPLNLVYRATSNVEEEGSWVGYGWNINVGTLNRLVRGLPDDMNGDYIKNYQNIRERTVNSTTIGVEANFGVQAGIDGTGLGLNAGVQGSLGFSFDNDNYTGEGIGVSVGGGVYAGINAGPLSVEANAGVTLSVSSTNGGSISTYAGFNAGLTYNSYLSIGFGQSVNRTFNTISGWEKPNVIGSYNISGITQEIQKNFIGSINNAVPTITNLYRYTSDGTGYKLKASISLGILEGLGLNMGAAISYNTNRSTTKYNDKNLYRGYGYMYSENASAADMLDFSRDNDGAINKDMPFLPPAIKTYDVFSSTAHGETGAFRADRSDFGIVRDPRANFQNTAVQNEIHQVDLKLIFEWDCWLGASIRYDNFKNYTSGTIASGGCQNDAVPYRRSNGRDQNLSFKPCGAITQVDEGYLSQVNGSGQYEFDKSHQVKGNSATKRPPNKEPIQIFTNGMIEDFPETVISKDLKSYTKNTFPSNTCPVKRLSRASSSLGSSKIGAIVNTNSSGQTFVYATPVLNNIKNEVAFRVNRFQPNNFDERNGVLSFSPVDEEVWRSNGPKRDQLYKNTITPAYATSYLLNAVLSPDYVDIKNDGISDDDLGSFVKFNYTRTDSDYRWRAPYSDKDTGKAFLNEGVKVTKFDDMGSYVAGSKEIWYAHSIESKNYVVEFYLSERADAKDSRSRIMLSVPYGVPKYVEDKEGFSRLMKLDCIKYYSKHDRYLNKAAATPLKTIYFDYDYSISASVPNSDQGGKLCLRKVRVRHGSEPLEYAETYNLGYASSGNPNYQLGAKDGWGNYAPNNRSLPLCEFPYTDQVNRASANADASAFHLTRIGLPSGGNINIEYESDDYAYVQDKRAMALTQVEGVGASPTPILTDAYGLYNPSSLAPYCYIYVRKPIGLSGGNYKEFLLNGSDLMYFSFNVNIAGNAFSDYDQVKGYAQVEDIRECPGKPDYLYIQVRPVSLTKTNATPSPMTNTAINMARAFATDQLYYQEKEHSDGRNRNQQARLGKAALQLGDALFGKNSIEQLMKRYNAGHRFVQGKSYVRLALVQPKIGGGSRVSRLSFDDEWNQMVGGESSSLVGYRYSYKDADGLSSGVASYESTIGGEENPLRSGASYALSNNRSTYPPYDPIEMVKEDPAGESFFPTGSVGYSRVVIESIHRDIARSAQSRLVQEFYTAKDFPYFSSYNPKAVTEEKDKDYPNPGVREVMLGLVAGLTGIEISNTLSTSRNSYDIRQSFVIETNDMHGKPKGIYNYRLLLKNGKTELVSSTEYYYHTNGNNGLANDVDVLQYVSKPRNTYPCPELKMVEGSFPKNNIQVVRKTLGVDIDVCNDSREVVSIENRTMQKRGGGLKICFFPTSLRPLFSWVDNTHTHLDYFKATVTTKIVNRYGILKSVRNYEEGAETIVQNKYYDPITGEAVVQVVKDKYGDDVNTTNIPAYWTKTNLEPAYLEYPYFGKLEGAGVRKEVLLPSSLTFTHTTANAGYLSGSGLLHTSFNTSEDLFHPGDELFVRAQSNRIAGTRWHRLYVVDVQVNKSSFSAPDPLAWRYGNGTTTGANYQVFLAPYKVSNPTGAEDFRNGDNLNSIDQVFKYRSGRKNMLNFSAGSIASFVDPFTYGDSAIIGKCKDSIFTSPYNNGDGKWEYSLRAVKGPGFLKPAINASASRYDDTNAILGGLLSNLIYNPVSLGLIGQPYVSNTYALNGNRKDPSSTMLQRKNGILPNWYYWLPARVDSVTNAPRTPLLTHYDDLNFNLAANVGENAVWYLASKVTKSIPSLGPVEETNPLGIFSSIFLEPLTKQVQHMTANGKFGQTWVENFEDLQRVRKYNGIMDLLFSPFQNYLPRLSTLADGYEVYLINQVTLSNPNLNGSFSIEKDQAHTGTSSLLTTNTVNFKIMPKRNSGNKSHFSNTFDFNLDNPTNQKYTYEVWVKRIGTNIVPPSVLNGVGVNLNKVSATIDGWTLYRTTIAVNENNPVTFVLPSGQYYDDLRVFPATANVKSYVYHPFKNYLMAVLDENNNATFYEYNSRNQLIRLKKETEKGIITVTENIKNIRKQ